MTSRVKRQRPDLMYKMAQFHIPFLHGRSRDTSRGVRFFIHVLLPLRCRYIAVTQKCTVQYIICVQNSLTAYDRAWKKKRSALAKGECGIEPSCMYLFRGHPQLRQKAGWSSQKQSRSR